LNRKPDGQFAGESRVEISGELANFIKSVYFQAGEGKATEILKKLTPVDAETVVLKDLDALTRASTPITYKLTYSAAKNRETEKNSVVVDLHYLARSRFPGIPTEIEQHITFHDSFLVEEEKYDCLVRGPYVNVDRRITNNETTAVLHDKVVINSVTEGNKANGDLKLSSDMNLRGLMDCEDVTLTLSARSAADKSQVPFEQKLDQAI
jgi:hypothetical protein